MRQLLALTLASVLALGAGASTTYTMRGTVLNTDTLFHAQIGPGTTQTSLFMKSADGRQMYVYYSKIDLTNPYIDFRAVMGQDKYAGTETVRSMSERKSKNGERYFMGVNGDFFYTSGTTMRGVSEVGIPIGPCITNGKLMKANSNSEYIQFCLDTSKQPHIGYTTFSGKVMKADGTSVKLNGINQMGTSSSYARLYNSNFFAGTNQSGTCAEVQLKMADGDSFGYSKQFKLVVTCDPSGNGDMDIPEDGYVLRGENNTYDFVNGLKTGDTLTVNFSVLMDGKEIIPQELISSWPHCLKDSVILDTEYILDEFSSQQPTTGMGIANGGKTIIFLTIDGRSPISSGARTSEMAELFQQLGCTDAFDFDSGGSSTFYTSALGVRNVPSDGAERPDGNGLFAISTAPDDSVIASISFVDWVAKVPKFGIYTPKFYGYNKYGMLINTNLEGVTITAPANVGIVKNDTTFVGSGSGSDIITAHYGDITCSIPVMILGDGTGISFKNDSIINDAYRDYTMEVMNTVDGTTLHIDPSVLSWSSSDESIVKIDAESGVLRGVADGTAYVYGTLGDFTDTMMVKVEKPTARVMAMDPNLDVTTWKISQTGGKNAVATAKGDGFDYTYTGASGRAPKIVLTKNLTLWSLPDTIRLRINPGEAPVKNVVIGIRPNGQANTYQTLTPDTVIANQELKLDLPTNQWLDAEDMANYPLLLSTIQLNMGTSTTGTEYTIHFNGFETVYAAVPAESGVKGDVNGDGKVDSSDLSALLSIILNNGTANEYPKADINGDGQVNTTDLGALMAIILAA